MRDETQQLTLPDHFTSNTMLFSSVIVSVVYSAESFTTNVAGCRLAGQVSQLVMAGGISTVIELFATSQANIRHTTVGVWVFDNPVLCCFNCNKNRNTCFEPFLWYITIRQKKIRDSCVKGTNMVIQE